MVNSQAFIQTIHNLTGEGTSKELAQFCRKWLEENGEKLSANEADRIFNVLSQNSNSLQFTLGIVCILNAKLSKLKTDADLHEFIPTLETILEGFDAKQLHWAPDIYDRLFENIGQILLKKNNPIWGITLLEYAILAYTRGNPNHLTNLHSILFCLCLKARYFDRILPFLQLDAIELFKQSTNWNFGASGTANQQHEWGDKTNGVSSSENSNPSITSIQPSTGSITSTAVSFIKNAVNTMSGSLGIKSEEPKATQTLFKKRNVLLYFYYGAMIYGALEKWEDAVFFLEHAICMPIKKNSAIVLEALKKFYIISLIIGRKKPIESLPTYRTAIIQRSFLALANVYIKLPVLIQKAQENKKDIVAILTEYLHEKQNVFAKDQNVGLMKVLINVCRDNAVKRLGNIFVSLQLNDVARMANLLNNDGKDGAESVEQIILRLRQTGQLTAQIDGRTQTVVFTEKMDASGHQIKEPSKEDVDTAIGEVIQLAHTIGSFDEAIRLNPKFIEKSYHQKGKERQAVGGNESGVTNSGSIFPEDEGFFLTGSP